MSCPRGATPAIHLELTGTTSDRNGRVDARRRETQHHPSRRTFHAVVPARRPGGWLFIAAGLAGASPASAQQTESRILGRVLDQSGAALPGVTVTVTSKSTGAERTAVTDGDGTYTVTNLAPGPYTVRAELAGFQPVRQGGRRRPRPGGQRHADPGRRGGDRDRHGARPSRRCSTSRRRRIGVNVSPEEVENLPVNGRNFANLMTLATGATSRRQRRLGERALQRQVEPAELPELRRRRRHLRVGREPRLPERHRLAVPPADLDGVGGRVPRQLGPGAGRERPRRRRQHHRDQQERQQPVPRLAVRIHARRRARFGQQVRRRRSRSSTLEPVRRLDWRPDRPQQDVLLRQLRRPAADDRPELHRSRAERRSAARASWPANRSAAAPARAPSARRRSRRCSTGSRAARCRPPTRWSPWPA